MGACIRPGMGSAVIWASSAGNPKSVLPAYAHPPKHLIRVCRFHKKRAYKNPGNGSLSNPVHLENRERRFVEVVRAAFYAELVETR